MRRDSEEGFVWGVRQTSPHTEKGERKRRITMQQFEYVCRCGKRFSSMFQQKRYVKYECGMKHVPLTSTGTCARIMEPTNTKAKE